MTIRAINADDVNAFAFFCDDERRYTVAHITKRAAASRICLTKAFSGALKIHPITRPTGIEKELISFQLYSAIRQIRISLIFKLIDCVK